MSKDRKPFRETKLGKFLGKIAPGILNIAGDLLPDAGVLGMVANLIKKDETNSFRSSKRNVCSRSC